MLTTKYGMRQDDLVVKRGRRWYFLLMKRREESLHIYRHLRRLYNTTKNVSWVTHTIPSVQRENQASKTAYESVLGALSAEFGVIPRRPLFPPSADASYAPEFQQLVEIARVKKNSVLVFNSLAGFTDNFAFLLYAWQHFDFLAFFDLYATDRQGSAAVVGSRRLWQIKGSLKSSAIACGQLYLLRLPGLW
ncbi:hypothetical protein MP228_013052 [Amoeboaphelidium protococcarum]|nr:hypothetical protein MP228_013052 [Amoeboaphelidium protococcarum]